MDLFVEKNTCQKINFDQMLKLLKIKKRKVFQCSRSQWLKEGDVNSSYHHTCIKAHRRSNFFFALQVDEGWVEGVVPVGGEVVSCFSNHYARESWDRPLLDCEVFPQISSS